MFSQERRIRDEFFTMKSKSEVGDKFVAPGPQQVGADKELYVHVGGSESNRGDLNWCTLEDVKSLAQRGGRVRISR